jgi:L-fucose isomerase
MRGKSYLSMGGVSMGIGGSIVNHDFLERWLGLRVETIDMVEFVRRMEEGIYDQEEFELAYAWVRTNCLEGKDYNAAEKQRSRAQKDEDWAKSVKMALIARDLMIGNPKLKAMGFGEEAHGRNAIASGFQGQRQWTDHLPNGDFLEAILTSSFDWNGIRHRRHRERRAQRCVDAFHPPAHRRRGHLCGRAHLLERGRGQTRHRLHAGGHGRGRHPAPDQLRPGHY